MIKDEALVFTGSSGQALVATAASTRVLDWEITAPNLGEGKPVQAVITVLVDANACTSYAFALESDSVEDFSTSSTKIIHATTGTILKAALIKGAQFTLPVPDTHQRYMRIYCTEAGTTEDELTIDAYLTQG